ncbi:MAG TPA: GIY-YIG nuclease family protein, partial [bacterium]|nr:GIY-YIG nuclease family protein [bacterium]
IASAIQCEKQLKKWSRAWKIRLIKDKNPGWKDLYPELTL